MIAVLDRLYYSSKAEIDSTLVLAIKAGDDTDTWSIVNLPDGLRIRVIGSRATVMAALGLTNVDLPLDKASTV